MMLPPHCRLPVPVCAIMMMMSWLVMGLLLPPQAKDAALLVLGSLHRELKKPTKPYAAVLEAMLVTHVLPEFK